MNNSIIQAQCVNLDELNHLFIDLSYTKQQDKTFNVYRSRCFNQKNKKYLQIDEIRDALSSIDKNVLRYIYLIGENSMSHPEFNHILRLCLNYSSVTIFSDGSCINDKKSRFLKRVEDEGSNEIIFKIFINHFDEKTNDEIAGRGSFRKALHAITSLNKYGFNPILTIKTNNSNYNDLMQGFIELGKKFKFETDDINFSFVPDEKAGNQNSDLQGKINIVKADYDCMHSRTLSKSGVYSCPQLLNDYRGRCGASLKDYSKKTYLETERCSICAKSCNCTYVNKWS